MNFLFGIRLLDSLYRHRNESEDINISIFSNISLKFAIEFYETFSELIDLQGPMIFFRSCRYDHGPISETKIGFEHIFEIFIFKGIKFCLRAKSFKSFNNEYIFV